MDSNKKRHNLTPAEKQALAVQKLMANADREVRLPGPSKEKHLRAPREMMKNVSGSSAGAGSGEFHVYKHSRRREYERIKLMEDKAKKVSVFAALFAALQQVRSTIRGGSATKAPLPGGLMLEPAWR